MPKGLRRRYGRQHLHLITRSRYRDMRMNSLKRKLVTHPRDWLWSSFTFYARKGPCFLRIDPMR